LAFTGFTADNHRGLRLAYHNVLAE